MPGQSNGDGNFYKWLSGLAVSIVLLLVGWQVAANAARFGVNEARLDRHEECLRTIEGRLGSIEGKIDILVSARSGRSEWSRPAAITGK